MQKQDMSTQNEEETMQITTKESDKFSIAKYMLQMKEDQVQKHVKDIEHLELVLAKVATKALYKLQMSME